MRKSFEGRGPATPGEIKTVAHVIAQMQAAGLQPDWSFTGIARDLRLLYQLGAKLANSDRWSRGRSRISDRAPAGSSRA